MESKSDPMRDDIEAYKSLSKQRDLSLSKAEDKAAIERINKRFNDYTQGFDGSVIMKALQELDAEQEKKQTRTPKAEGGQMNDRCQCKRLPSLRDSLGILYLKLYDNLGVLFL